MRVLCPRCKREGECPSTISEGGGGFSWVGRWGMPTADGHPSQEAKIFCMSCWNDIGFDRMVNGSTETVPECKMLVSLGA